MGKILARQARANVQGPSLVIYVGGILFIKVSSILEWNGNGI